VLDSGSRARIAAELSLEVHARRIMAVYEGVRR
jgi:hypothetical protein